MENPKIILLFSGKRKSGKDFITNHLQSVLKDQCDVIKISEPIKSHWAKEKNLSLIELLSDGAYKEKYRKQMIEWSDEIRKTDYGYFCRAACGNGKVKPIWIVSDIRRKTDILWFKETYGHLIRTIRINADDKTRVERGFIFEKGVDDVTSECDLDDYNEWNLVLNNGEGRPDLKTQLSNIFDLLSHLDIKYNLDVDSLKE